MNKLVFSKNGWVLFLIVIFFLNGCVATTEIAIAQTPIPTAPLTFTDAAGVIATQSTTAITSVSHKPTALPALALAEADELLQGPLIVYRVQHNRHYLLILDIGTWTFREITDEQVPLGYLDWHNNGCLIYTRDNLIDLQGNIVKNLGDGEAHFATDFLSPDKKKGARALFLGQQEGVDLEHIRVEILDRDDPLFRTELAPNGGAYSFAWSPDGRWLAYSDFDDNLILQVYRATPDGKIIEQLTHHLEDPGVIQLITWSPDGQQIAYAAQALLPNQREGWIGLLSLVDGRTMPIRLTHLQHTLGLWWDEAGNRVAFVGDSLYTAPEPLQGRQIHWVDARTGIIVNSFYESATSEGFFNLVTPVGNLDTIFFEGTDGYYILDANTHTHEKVFEQLLHDEIIRDFSAAPFAFSGEANCLENTTDTQ